jgi:hypothetical protein
MERACKHLVTQPFKGPGMRWNLETAEPLLRVRAALPTNPALDLRPYANRRRLLQSCGMPYQRIAPHTSYRGVV